MASDENKNGILSRLIEKGVKIPNPSTVEIGPEVSSERISNNGVVIHAGCKIFGKDTLVMSGVHLGYEASVTVNNCQLGKGVRLKGGFHEKSVFLHGASMGSGAQVREACLLEEGAKGAHNVGLKQTILFPFVTLGSLINFCDCLMAGGTDERNHSEVGSSFIHFNYTPNQDKATPSLIGDVPRGVMINQPPIFLGGQGGLVGPAKIEYGVVVAAGTIIRKDINKGDTILLGQPSLSRSMPFHSGLYSNIKRIIKLNTNYIANLIALRRYYLDVRSMFMEGDVMENALYKGAIEKIEMAINERIKRLGQVAQKMSHSIEIYRKVAGESASEKTIQGKQEFQEQWPVMENVFMKAFDFKGEPHKRDNFLGHISEAMKTGGKDYVSVVKGMTGSHAEVGVLWLQDLVSGINQDVFSLLPKLGIK